jgi:hypothetical protein
MLHANEGGVVRRLRISKRGARQASCVSSENAEEVRHAEFLIIAVVPRNRDSGRQLETPFEHVSEHPNVARPCVKRLDLHWFERPAFPQSSRPGCLIRKSQMSEIAIAHTVERNHRPVRCRHATRCWSDTHDAPHRLASGHSCRRQGLSHSTRPLSGCGPTTRPHTRVLTTCCVRRSATPLTLVRAQWNSGERHDVNAAATHPHFGPRLDLLFYWEL